MQQEALPEEKEVAVALEAGADAAFSEATVYEFSTRLERRMCYESDWQGS